MLAQILIDQSHFFRDFQCPQWLSIISCLQAVPPSPGSATCCTRWRSWWSRRSWRRGWSSSSSTSPTSSSSSIRPSSGWKARQFSRDCPMPMRGDMDGGGCILKKQRTRYAICQPKVNSGRGEVAVTTCKALYAGWASIPIHQWHDQNWAFIEQSHDQSCAASKQSLVKTQSSINRVTTETVP